MTEPSCNQYGVTANVFGSKQNKYSLAELAERHLIVLTHCLSHHWARCFLRRVNHSWWDNKRQYLGFGKLLALMSLALLGTKWTDAGFPSPFKECINTAHSRNSVCVVCSFPELGLPFWEKTEWSPFRPQFIMIYKALFSIPRECCCPFCLYPHPFPTPHCFTL